MYVLGARVDVRVGEHAVPAVEPYAPWFVRAVAGGCGQRPVLLFKRPKEERVVWVARPVHPDVSRKIARERPSDVRQRLGYLEVC